MPHPLSSPKPGRIVIFAKAPEEAKVKTRLIPSLGVAGATRLAQRLLLATVREALAVPGIRVELCGSPSPADPVWLPLDLDPRLIRTDQGTGDLGERLARAAQRVVSEGEHLLMIGSDCPQLTRTRLFDCMQSLAAHDTVMIPALDGGYVLLGLRAYQPLLFAAMPWSTDRVAAETRLRIAQLSWSLREYEPLPDIDEPRDLVHLPQHLQPD